MTNLKCTLLMITTALVYGCSEEPPAQRILSDADTFDGTVHIEVVSFEVGANKSSSARFNITNFTDYTVNFVRCDAYAYYNDNLQSVDEDELVFAHEQGTADLEPGQTRAGQFIFADSPELTRINRVEWVCSYQEGRNFDQVIFEGRS